MGRGGRGRVTTQCPAPNAAQRAPSCCCSPRPAAFAAALHPGRSAAGRGVPCRATEEGEGGRGQAAQLSPLRRCRRAGGLKRR
eukprot:7459368-Alexandrium_andersonii.AAC.1